MQRLNGMFRALKPSLTSPAVPALELIKRTVKEVIDDDCMSIAAQLAYYFALALFPALLFIVALASYLPYNVINDVVGGAGANCAAGSADHHSQAARKHRGR